MKLNNKGFAVSILLYSIIAIIIFIMTVILTVYATSFHNRTSLVDSVRTNIVEKEMIDLDSLGISVTINPEMPDVITKGDHYPIVLSNGYSLGGRDGVLTCNIDGVAVGDPVFSTTSGLDVGEHTIECQVNATDAIPVADSKTINVTYQSYTIKNIVRDGSFEGDGTAWVLENASIVSDGYDSDKSLKLSKNVSLTQASQQTSISPILNHKYYGALMFKIIGNTSFSADDDRFEWFNAENFDGRMVFARKNLISTTWVKISHIQSISNSSFLDGEYVIQNPWVIRNFFKNATVDSHIDQLLIVDLTEAFGSGNEPSKDWCDSHIFYFDNQTTIYK